MQQQRCAATFSNCATPSALLHLRPQLPLKSSSFLPPKRPTLSKRSCSLTLHHTTSNCTHHCQDHQKDHLNTGNNPHPPADNVSSSDHFHYSVPAAENPDAQSHEKAQTSEEGSPALIGHFTSMWWVDFRAALGQRINIEGIVSSVSVFAKDRHLALPHVMVPDVRHIDWAELRRRGFRGVVFDKDNTITVPYAFTLWPPLEPSIHLCKSVFGNDIAVFSNSAGLYEYDHDGSKARALEKAIGIKVIRHRVKKPAGTAEEIEKHFGCKSSQLIMVGDRPFTDIVYGNRNGFLTILTNPLSVSEEPFIVRKVRKLEEMFVNYWLRRGLKPTNHSLLPDAMKCIKDSTTT